VYKFDACVGLIGIDERNKFINKMIIHASIYYNCMSDVSNKSRPQTAFYVQYAPKEHQPYWHLAYLILNIDVLLFMISIIRFHYSYSNIPRSWEIVQKAIVLKSNDKIFSY
jgi:hypothetical protein